MIRFVAAVPLLFLLVASGQAQEAAADPAKLRETLETTLKAYNKDDAKAFCSDWAKSLMILDPEFKFEFYKSLVKPKYGQYKEKTLKFIAKGSDLKGTTPTAYFEAEFAKETTVLIETQFGAEDGSFKLLRLSFPKKK